MTMKTPPIERIIWANITKWQMIRDVSDDDLARVLCITRLNDRRKNLALSVQEMGIICGFLAIEPEELLER